MDAILEQPQSVNRGKRGTGLRFIPVADFSLIPRSLVEAVKPRTFDPEKLHRLGPALCANPLNILGVFAPMDEKRPDYGVVKGFLWAGVNPLDDKIHVHMLSVDKAFQKRGIVREALGILERVRSQNGLKGIVFGTTRPGAFEKLGFRRSETILMEV